MGLRGRTNNFAKLSAAYYMIRFPTEKNCHALQLFGDSMIVCDWLNKRSYCWSFSLRHILDEALRLISNFDFFSCNHIYREHNTEANSLSKEGANQEQGIWLIIEKIDGVSYQYYHRPFMDIMV